MNPPPHFESGSDDETTLAGVVAVAPRAPWKFRDVLDASVGPAGLIRMVASPSSMVRKIQPIDKDSLRVRFPIRSSILFSCSQVS